MALALEPCCPAEPATTGRIHQVNDRVRVSAGPFEGLTGVVRRVTERKIHVEVEVFRRPTTIAISASELESVG